MGDPTAVSCRHLFAAGRVQGVAFRWSTAARARALGLAGWVRNLSGGRVEVWLEGPADAVTTMVEWLGHGPPAARVEQLSSSEARPAGVTGFTIRDTSQG